MRRASSFSTFLGDIFNCVNKESMSHFRPTSFKNIAFNCMTIFVHSELS